MASGLGGLASSRASEEYGRLEQTSWAPPSWVFGPTWTVLYLLMAVAAWLVWRTGPSAQSRLALTFYAVQLVLNAAWTPLFFGLGWRGIAFAELSVLLVVLIATVVMFWRLSRPAGAMLVLAEASYTVTDPPIRAVRKVVPPLRLGGAVLDLAWSIVLLLCFVGFSLVAAIAALG